MRDTAKFACRALVIAAAVFLFSHPASCEDIDVAQYRTSTSGFPYAVADAKGFFKEEGADVTGIIGTIGGGSDVRNLVAAGLPYADVSLSSAISAIQQGADIVIVSESAQNAASLVWVTMPNSPISSINDLKGKRLGFSSPQSFTQAAAVLMLDRQGYKRADVTLVSTSGFGPGLTALEHGGVDITISPLPDLLLNPGKYKPVIWGRDVLPPLSNTVGVVPRSLTKERPQFICAVIAARRKAVEYMIANRDESAAIIAKAYKVEPSLVTEIMTLLIDRGTVDGVPYWGPGSFDYRGIENMIDAGKLVGMMKGEIDFKTMVDESFLPDDLKSKAP
jgi:NitT/TauT family transport system substrate-binding protein